MRLRHVFLRLRKRWRIRGLTVSLNGKRCCKFACACGSLSAFDGQPQRQAMASRNIRPVIPYRANRRKGGRLNRKAYAERNKIERLIGKLKEFRRIATRYDKLKETFLGIIQLALAYICLKANLIVNRA
jgi:transposase